jgi:methylthioribose-1-phosphate isomerase
MIKTVEWTAEGVRMIDQRLLPTQELYITFRTYEEVAEAIRNMTVRGAPAIGVAAAFGLALGVSRSNAKDVDQLEAEFEKMCRVIGETRPTAVNLFWAIERMRGAFDRFKRESSDVGTIQQRIVGEGLEIYEDDLKSNRRMGAFGAELLPQEGTVLTHCNAGALATAGDYGTALGVIRGARDAGKRIAVIADETRPFLQGARLTAWELQKDDIQVTLITDNMAGHIMKKGMVDAIVVGADRIAANGDTANKVGTYMVAVLARTHNIPFYVAAPVSTVDLNAADGDAIPIEERDVREVTHIKDHQLAPSEIAVHNPAFDVTPNEFITAIITDRGVARPPFSASLKHLVTGQ